MKKYFYTLIAIVILSFVLQACVPQQLEVNPGFGKKVPSEAPAAKAPIQKPAEGPEAKKPIWKVGYKWEYEWENPGGSGTLTEKIIREEDFDGIPCFVIKSTGNEIFYAKDVIGPVASKKGGEVNWKNSAPFQPYSWPLKVGKQWNNVYTLEKPQEETSTNIDLQVVVTKLEEVTVPAGTFKAFKIEVRHSYNNDLISEWWYSPKVKSYVKSAVYSKKGRLQWKLKSYTLHAYPTKDRI